MEKPVKHRKAKIVLITLISLFLAFLCIPVPRFDKPYSTVLTDRNGELLGAKIADDGQWRFPATNNYSPKYVACLLEYEDRWFFFHPGFNPVAFVKSFIDNMNAGEVVRGGSTISMQVVRMSRDNPPRTYAEKFWEVILAMRLELHYSKRSILNMYAANAPFGGNVVGIDAAAWRYPAIFKESTFALYEINLYTRLCAICQPLSILQWQLTADIHRKPLHRQSGSRPRPSR